MLTVICCTLFEKEWRKNCFPHVRLMCVSPSFDVTERKCGLLKSRSFRLFDLSVSCFSCRMEIYIWPECIWDDQIKPRKQHFYWFLLKIDVCSQNPLSNRFKRCIVFFFVSSDLFYATASTTVMLCSFTLASANTHTSNLFQWKVYVNEHTCRFLASVFKTFQFTHRYTRF